MISKAVKREIKHLLEIGGMSHREIAERAGVSRQTVTSVNKRGPVGIKEVIKEVITEEVIGGIRNRCSTCGALVYGECYECRLKEAKKNGEIPRVYIGTGGSLDFDLLDEEMERLKELREAIQLELAEDDD